MEEQSSGIDSWASIAQEPTAERSLAGYMPLVLSVAGALGVAPFAIMRWMTADWPIAIIDSIIVIGFVLLGTYIYRTRKVRVASILITVLCVAGALVTIQVRGPQQAYWAYPAMMACFYLVKPREAIAMTLAMTAVLAVQLKLAVDVFRAGTIVSTILIAAAFAFALSVINNRQQSQLLSQASKDPLTGVGNRRAFVEKLANVISIFERTGSPSSLVLIDIDYFKKVNDTHGHKTGDEVLRRVSHIIDLRIRQSDTSYRIGGEEFVVIVDGQGMDTAARLAEDLRERIESSEILPGVAVTISVGVAEVRSEESHEFWLHRADEALYEAKHDGRNTVKLAG